jgi:hypothetical protein
MPNRVQAQPFFRPALEEQRYLPECPFVIGESLVWISIQYAADRPQGGINVLDLASRENVHHPLPGRPGFFAKTADPGVVLIGLERRLTRTHPLASDALLAAVLLGLCSAWLSWSSWAGYRAAIVQTALIAVLIFRRRHPSAVFLAASAIAFAQWLLGFPLLGDVALLVALYTVAAHESRIRALLATGLLGAGSVMAAAKWQLAGTVPRSLLFLFAMVVAALFAGLTAASGSRYLAWMDERARRLETERDQQAVIAAAAERTRIARELHDIVAHSLSVVITLADAAAVVSRADPARGVEAMTEASEVARRALTDLRAMLGVLRTDEAAARRCVPHPGLPMLASQVDLILDFLGLSGTGQFHDRERFLVRAD